MEKTTREEYRLRVSQGAEYLDTMYDSEWYWNVNQDILDLENTRDCVAGQLEPNDYASYVDSLHYIGPDYRSLYELCEWGVENGFDLASDYVREHGSDDYEILTELWIAEIDARINAA
jgi:hypothetical protein